MTTFTTIAAFLKWTGDDAPSEAELALIQHALAGTPCILGDGKRPEAPTVLYPTARRIRADLLRHLILGGDAVHPVHSIGVQLVGAVIVGPLNLDFSTAKGQTTLGNCLFTDRLSAMHTQLRLLTLSGSLLPGLDAEGAEVTGDVFLLNGFHATGEVSLAGAKIGGQLECDGGRFENKSGHALKAQGVEVTGSVYLRDGFSAMGEVSVASAKIGGQLSCVDATFENEGGDALNAQRLWVAGPFFWQIVTVTAGRVLFSSAQVGVLVDDLASWPTGERVFLDGFSYDQIGGDAPVDADTRLQWLKRGSHWQGRFYPQPYTQLAKVLREMGHETDARIVLHERERLLGVASRAALIKQLTDPTVGYWSGQRVQARWAANWLVDFLSRRIVGYGHRPWLSVALLMGLWAITSALASAVWTEGSFAPNSDVIIVSDGWTKLMNEDCLPEPLPGCQSNPANAWSAKDAAGVDWDSFNAVGYAADLVIPILDLGQTDAWAPSKDRGGWGWGLWWGRWVLAALGWLFTALGAAAVTGIMQRK